jgi:hypothetical protein
MSRLAGKINREPGEYCVHRFDAAKPPAPVRAAAARGQLRQRLHMATLNFSGRGEFFEFFSHSHYKIVFLKSRIHYDSIKHGK